MNQNTNTLMFKIIRESGEVVVQPQWPQYHPAWQREVERRLEHNQRWMAQHMATIKSIQ